MLWVDIAVVLFTGVGGYGNWDIVSVLVIIIPDNNNGTSLPQLLCQYYLRKGYLVSLRNGFLTSLDIS